MNRIEQKFKELKKDKKKAFIAFITAGDPNLKATEELVYTLERAGADIVELGVPFSDPMADGPTIQASSQRALQKNVNLTQILQLVDRIRQKSSIPLALMTYYNPILHYGEKKFIDEAKARGLDGVIIPDLPPEEGKNLRKLASNRGISTVLFLAPTTTQSRMRKILPYSNGFVYYVSLAGVTGSQKGISKELASHIKQAKRMTKTPICVGFGISTPKQVHDVSRYADGVIVGSAIVKVIEKYSRSAKLHSEVSKCVLNLKKGLK